MARKKVQLDPAVAAILGDAEQRAEQRAMTPAQRRRAQARVKRQSITLELNAELVPLLRAIAEGLGISPAGVADRLLVDALARFAAGAIDFDGCLEPSRSPRYQWIVAVDTAGLAAAVHARLEEGEKSA